MTMIAMDDGVRLNVEADSENGKPVLVLANSLATNLSMWDPQLEAFRRDHRLVRFDARGHGRSDVPPGPYSIGRLGRDLLGVLDAIGVERARLVGLSIGGMIVGWVAANAPERVEKVAMCCSAPHMAPEIWIERAAEGRRDGLDNLAAGSLARWFTPRFRAEHPESVERMRAMITATPREGYAGFCEVLATMDQREDLKRIAAPALVVAAADDPMPPEAVRAWAATVPGARYEEIADAAHLANVEQPERFGAVVSAFLRG